MKKQRIQLILIVIVLILLIGGYFWVKNMNTQKEADKKNESSAVSVTNVVQDDVTEMEYLKDGKTITLIREGTLWYDKEDKGITLQQSDINTMLSYACSISTETVIEQPQELSEYGLDNLYNTISLTLKDSSVVQIMIGDYLSISGEYYAMTSGDSMVYTIPSYYVSAFDKSIEDLTQK